MPSAAGCWTNLVRIFRARRAYDFCTAEKSSQKSVGHVQRSVYSVRLASARGQAKPRRNLTMLPMHCIEGTLSGYAGHSALDAAQKPVNRQWTENSVDFGGRQVGLM